MAEAVAVVLAAWVVGTVAAFALRPGWEAAIGSLVAGLVLLPTGRYPASVFMEPVGHGGAMHALTVPTASPFNKATAAGLGCLAGAVLFDWPGLRRLRPSWRDAPMALWCATPLLSAWANGLPTSEGLAQVRYLGLAWGAPYLMGRLYLGTDRGLRGLAVGLTAAGLLTVPLGLLESVNGPFLYGLAYGPHPYQYEGAGRPLGSRPLLFMEHGNQLGMWSAVGAVASAWLWRGGRVGTVLGVPCGIAAAVLAAVCLADQSLGAIVLAVAGVSPLAAAALWPRLARRPRLAAGGLALAAVAVALAAWGFAGGGARETVRGFFVSAGKGSFTWRLARSEEYLPRVARRPWLGWGGRTGSP